MKKKIIGSFTVLAIVALSAYNVYFNNEKEQLSALALANIEALANVEDLSGGESGSGKYCVIHTPCFNSYGNTTGTNRATSYSGSGCNRYYHYHSCSSCYN